MAQASIQAYIHQSYVMFNDMRCYHNMYFGNDPIIANDNIPYIRYNNKMKYGIVLECGQQGLKIKRSIDR